MRPELLELASQLAARGEGFALVTVVRREPPSSARVGDTALVTPSGEVHGWVAGEPFDAECRRRGRDAMALPSMRGIPK